MFERFITSLLSRPIELGLLGSFGTVVPPEPVID